MYQMKVLINGEVFDSEKQPILVKLNLQDIINISAMKESHCTVFCSYPEDTTKEEVEKINNMGEYLKEHG